MKRFLFLLILILICENSQAQIDEPFFRWPRKTDSLSVNEHRELIHSSLSKENESEYFTVASALYQLKKNDEAKRMFLQIVESDLSKYNSTYYHSSDVPGDTTKKTYGYGSYTSNYKNSSSLYLAKILIEQKKYDSALKYVTDADKKYEVDYTCGTGSMAYSGQLIDLYSLCYAGLGQFEKSIELLLPSCLSRFNTPSLLPNILKTRYSKDELKNIFNEAIATIKLDGAPYMTYGESTSYDLKGNIIGRESFSNLKMNGTIKLFKKTVPLLGIDVFEGEDPKQSLVFGFLSSYFYADTTDDYSYSLEFRKKYNKRRREQN